jgi:hypothetical protein
MEGLMRPSKVYRILTAAVAGAALSVPPSATVFAQAGSTGGTIGKTDKSISGGEEANEPRQSSPKREQRTASPASAKGIRIISAVYGIEGHTMTVTTLVGGACNGKTTCRFPVSNDFFGRDPIYGPIKHVNVRWSRGSDHTSSDYQEYTTADLSCREALSPRQSRSLEWLTPGQVV